MEWNGAKTDSTFVLSAKDAARLLQIKHILPHGTTANIQGTVTAVSELIKINKDCVFMVELQGTTRIIVKQPQFHKWHDHLVIGKCFVFTNLRPTSLSEAYRPQQRVFIPWTGSCLLSPSEDNTSDLAVLDFQEWLSHLGLSLPTEGFCSENCNDDEEDAGICSTVDFHQGVVTDSSQAEFGIFQLEDETRLFLCYVPKLKRPKEVYVGCCVTVYNVHTSVCSQTGKKQLFCCTRSTVRVADREGETSDKEGQTVPDDPPVVTMVQQYAVLQSELSPLLQLYQHICQVMDLHLGDGTREKRKGVKTALKYLAASLCSADRQRNYVMEFCQHQHFCPLRSTAADTDSLVPQLTSLTDILQDTMTADEESSNVYGKNSTSTLSDEETGWRVTMKVVSKRALSWLTTNPATGRLQVKDSQQAIDLVIVDSQRTPEPPSHHCHGLCDCSVTAKGEHSQCPYFHPCCLGQLIVVNNFTVVSETFPDVSECSRGDVEHKQRLLSYMVVAAHDCVRLKIESHGKTTTSKSDYSLRKSATETTDHRDLSDADARLVQITEKCHPAAQTTGSKKRGCVQFCAEGFFVTSKNSNNKDTDSESASAVTSLAAACDEAPPAKKACQEYPASSKPLAVEEKITSTVKETGESSSTCQVEQSHRQGLQRGQPVSLTFEEGSCRWFDVIHPPGLYRFRGREGSAPFQWPQVDSRLQAAMERTGTQMAVRVSASAAVERVFLDCGNNGLVISLPSLQSALSNGSPGQLVSFRGVVMWRRHPASQLPEVIRTAARTVGDLGRTGQRGDPHMTLAGLLGTRSVCVGVKDEGGDPSVTASVYFSFSSLVYPLGLLPGAVVDFHRLEKKTSKKANNIYFTFLPVSSLSVVSAPSFGAVHKKHAVTHQQSAVNRNITPHWDDAPHWLLIDLWRQPEVPDIFVVTCHVCQFFRLSLKSMCGHCGSLFQSDGCSAPACHNTHHSVFLPRISILVEDGSGQAVVDINKSCPDDVTRRLLHMSSTQWQLLEKVVQQQGEVFLQKFGSGGGTAIEDLLSLLCDSRRIKRPCRLMLRKPLYSNKPGKSSTAMLETLTADELVTRNINTGEETVETLCLPYQHLDCLDIQDL